MISVFYLWPTSPWFVGAGQANGLFPRSDTLSAALFTAWRSLAAAEAEQAGGVLPFRVSSALPVTRGAGGELTHFYPLPVGSWAEGKADSRSTSKALKKALFGDEAMLRAKVKGEPAPGNTSLAGGAIVASSPLAVPARFASASERLRLAVDRATNGPIEGLLFSSKTWQADAGCGFAVLVAHETGEDQRLALATLRLLGLDGLGTDRSTGNGKFEVEGPIPWTPPQLGEGHRLLLSLCNPSQDDVAAGVLDGRYALVDRGGWVTSPGAQALRRGRARFLTEGSVFPASVPASAGRVVVVQPAKPDLGLHHPVYRDGRAVTMDIGGPA